MIKVMSGLTTLRRYCDGDEAPASFYAKGHSLLTNDQPVSVHYQGNGPDTFWCLASYVNGDNIL